MLSVDDDDATTIVSPRSGSSSRPPRRRRRRRRVFQNTKHLFFGKKATTHLFQTHPAVVFQHVDRPFTFPIRCPQCCGSDEVGHSGSIYVVCSLKVLDNMCRIYLSYVNEQKKSAQLFKRKRQLLFPSSAPSFSAAGGLFNKFNQKTEDGRTSLLTSLPRS